jgi:MoaA/NifB/PqqE/SkfB family radical SAM enzyme
MTNDLVKVLAKLNLEENYEGIIQYTLPIIVEHPEDYSALYCLGMAYVGRGDKSKGLKYLQILINKSLVICENNENKLFINRVKVQVVEITEISLHGGDKLGEKTIQMIIDIHKFGQEIGDKDLIKSTEEILKKWYHKRPLKTPIISLIPDSPFTLQVEPTNTCNLNCTMCPRTKMNRKIGFMEPSIFDEMLDSWKNKFSTKEIKHLIFETIILLIHRGSLKLFFMGESLLHPELNRLIESGNDKGCKVGLQTNGVLLQHDEIRRKLLRAKPGVIGISLDGIDSTSYESVRQGSRWEQVYKGIQLLHKERHEMGLDKKIWIMVSSIIPEWNQTSLERAEKFLSPIRPFVDHLGFIPLSRERDPKFYNENGDIILYSKETIIIPPNFDPLCIEPLTKLNVLWDGTVTACCYDIDGDMPIGHVSEGIDNIWNGDKIHKLQQALLNRETKMYPLCSACMGNSKS